MLVYSGEKDYICNWRGGERWTNLVSYGGTDEFNKMDYEAWKVDGKEAGLYKAAEGMTFLRVHEAGHMVPIDQPKNTFQMLSDFMYPSPKSDWLIKKIRTDFLLNDKKLI